MGPTFKGRDVREGQARGEGRGPTSKARGGEGKEERRGELGKGGEGYTVV